jgi:hypothetical protein
MDFANESYVRLYTRDTMTWKRFNWQAKAVQPLLLRKLDRSGVLELAGLEPAEAVALATELPLEVVAEAMPVFFKLGVVVVNGDALVVPRFIEAQECNKSDALRAKEYRERRRSQAMAAPSQNVTRESQDVTQPSREITARHDASQSVTLCSAVLPSALHSSAEREIARADSDDWIVGRLWFVAAFLGGDCTQAPDSIKWRDDYAALGRKPKTEREAVAATAGADPWVIANRGGSANPGHFVKHWGRYKAGGPKTVPRSQSSAEVAEADRRAAVASKLVQVRQEYAAQIKAAVDDGDDYTANRLTAERDHRLARLQAQAS